MDRFRTSLMLYMENHKHPSYEAVKDVDTFNLSAFDVCHLWSSFIKLLQVLTLLHFHEGDNVLTETQKKSVVQMAMFCSSMSSLIYLSMQKMTRSIQMNTLKYQLLNLFSALKLSFVMLIRSYFGSKEEMDRLSSLPDHIICHILSFLPSKDAVASSILSTRWKYVWASVPVLDFDTRLHREVYPLDNRDANHKSEICFQNFVSRAILLHDMSSVIKFRLIYQCYDRSAPIGAWLHVAITRNIQELELGLSLSVPHELVEFPGDFFTSNSLVVLKLSHMPLNVPSFVCFPRLKILELRRIMYLDDKCIQNLLSGCQILEELVIEEIARDRPMVVDISMHNLIRFSFTYRFGIHATEDCPYKFIINAPNLDYFHVKGRISDVFVVGNLEALQAAHVDLRRTAVPAENYSICHRHIFNFLKRMSNVKLLTLSTEIVQLLCEGYDQSLSTFCNLKELAFGIGFDLGWKRLLTEFIKCSRFLEVLTLDNKGVSRDIEDLSKTPLQCLPENVLSHLKGILIGELYANFMPESVVFLPQDVAVLKRLKINCRCPTMLRSQIGLP